MCVTGIVLAFLGIYSPQIFLVSVLGQYINCELFYHDRLVVRRYPVRSLFDEFLDRRLVISVRLDFQPIQLNLFGTQCDSLAHACYPTRKRFTRMSKDELYVYLVTGVLTILNGFQGDRLVVRPIHNFENSWIQ